MDTSGHDGRGARLAHLLGRLDSGVTRAETLLVTVIAGIETAALCLWVLLRGLATPPDSESTAGILVRAFLASVILGAIAARSTRRLREGARYGVIVAAGLAGTVASWLFPGAGVDYTSNVLNWLQQASSLTLLGGLKGVATRLTLVLALVGGSLAAGAGKHITIDLLTRWVGPRVRRVLETTTWGVSAAICVVTAWGFFDHIAIESFGASRDSRAQDKAAVVLKGLDEHAFILARQLELDVSSVIPVLVEAKPYSAWLDDRRWNAWIEEAGFARRYGRAALDNLRLAPGETRAPMVAVPKLGEPRGELINAANLILPFGLLAIAARMLLRAMRSALERSADGQTDANVPLEVTL